MVHIEMTPPEWASDDMLFGAVTTGGGIIAADYVATSIMSRAGWTGSSMLWGSAAMKLGTSLVSFLGSRRIGGNLSKALFFVSLGSAASVAHDAIAYMFPESTPSAAARQARATPSQAVSVRRAPTSRTSQTTTPTIRAETPSGESIGGF